MFNPIAIIGRACLLPGALTPEQLWQNRLAGLDSLSNATQTQWRIDPALFLDNKLSIDKTWTLRCGYIQGFEKIFDPNVFNIPASKILQWDILCQWLLYTGYQALNDAGYSLKSVSTLRTGTIIGNLSYPTGSLSQYAESIWLSEQNTNALQKDRLHETISQCPHPDNRFMSGLPVFRMAEGLGLTADAFAIDAACASSIYSIKLACDRLQAGSADMMLAGGINAADGLFLQIGFTVLQAISKSGRCLPFNSTADGLLPSQGVTIVVLKRLEDAINDQNPIYGIIRGIGLSNDGADGGFLVPKMSGQVEAMKKAYTEAELDPNDISWLECHATGTPLGDTTEIKSMQQIFNSSAGLDIGTLKKNICHNITTSF